jgi:hypothetical protein
MPVETMCCFQVVTQRKDCIINRPRFNLGLFYLLKEFDADQSSGVSCSGMQ